MNRQTIPGRQEVPILENKMREALDVSWAYIEFDTSGNIVTVNDFFVKALGYTNESELIGQHHSIFCEPSYSTSPEYKNFWEQLRDGKPQTGEFKRLSKSGEPVWLNASYTPVNDDEGRVVKIMKIASDVTERKLVESRFRDALDVSWAYIEFDTEGHILTANDFFVNALGYQTKEQLIGQHHRIFCEQSYAETDEYKSFWKSLKAGEAQSGEFKRLSKNGSPIWLNASYTPIKDENGEVIKIMKIASDITENKLIETRFRNALDVNWAYIEFDTEGHILTANDFFVRSFGFHTIDEIKGQHHRIFCDKPYTETLDYKEFWESLRQGNSQSGEFKRYSKDGGVVWLNASYTPVVDEKGQVIKIMKLAADITESKKISEELKRQQENIKEELKRQVNKRTEELESSQAQLIESEKMASLGQLIAGIAHEINTPMGAIKATVEILIEANRRMTDNLPEFSKVTKYVDADLWKKFLETILEQKPMMSTREERKLKRRIRQEVEERGYPNENDVGDLLGDMLFTGNLDDYEALLTREENLAALELANILFIKNKGADTINLAADKCRKIVFALKSFSRVDYSGDFDKMSITENIDTVLILYQNQLKYGFEVVKNYDEDLPILYALGDALSQVWTNLIHNAIQAMGADGGVLTITIKNEPEWIHVMINDTGPGIPEDLKDKIFKIFFTTKSKGEGSGLGLDIVRKIVEKHAGKIYVESVPGDTTFHVKIPKKEYIMDLVEKNKKLNQINN